MFKTGQSGNPNGRKKGTKNKMPRQALEKILFVCAKFEAEGKDIYTVYQDDPKRFYEIFVRPILPKEVVLTGPEGGPVKVCGTINFCEPEK